MFETAAQTSYIYGTMLRRQRIAMSTPFCGAPLSLELKERNSRIYKRPNNNSTVRTTDIHEDSNCISDQTLVSSNKSREATIKRRLNSRDRGRHENRPGHLSGRSDRRPKLERRRPKQRKCQLMRVYGRRASVIYVALHN